jgi:hypothetical protein
MKKLFIRNRISAFPLFLALSAAGFLLISSSGSADSSEKMKATHQKAFQVYARHCLSCHDSVADPERPGRTRDDWHLVVNIMHGYGLDVSNEDSEMIIDLLYDLREGLEKEAG